MTRRRLEIAILALGALFVLFLLFSFRPGRRPSRSAPAREQLPTVAEEKEAGQATTVLKGFDYTETVSGKPLFRIQSDRTVGFGPAAGLVPNVYVLESVTLTAYPQEGEAVTVRSDRAEYDQRTKQAKLSGNVRWTDEAGALGETERAEFDPSRRLVVAPAAVHFTRGTFDLSARSGRYDLSRREVILEGPVQGAGTGEGSGGLTALSAEGAVYRREESSIQLSGRVSAAGREGDRLSCDRLVLKLERDGGRLQWARAEGHVSGALVSLPAATASADRPAGPRRYAADSAAVLFGVNGEAQSLSLTGQPADVSDGAGRVSAETIEILFQSGRALSALARGRVHVETEKNRADSERASLSFKPSGEVEAMELSQGVRMEGEDRSARSDKAVNLPERGVWILTGEGASATVESGGSRVSAARIEIDEKRRLLAAEGSSRALFTPAPSPGPGRAERKAPALVGDPSRPTHAKAQRIVLDDAARVAILTGDATLWQDASSLAGEAITLNDGERSAVAVGRTRTVLLGSDAQSKARSPANAERPASTVVTAHRVTYREGDSMAVFEGAVAVTRGVWRASADKATAIFGADRKLERVEMAGGVSLADTGEGRSGRADRAIDFPSEGKTVLEGSPAWVADLQGDRVTGAILTITDHGRRVEVTAPRGGKTETVHRTSKS